LFMMEILQSCPDPGRALRREDSAMELVPWKPLREVSALRRQVDDLLRSFLGETPLPVPFGEGWAPAVDVSETDENIFIRAEIPGLEAKDIDLSILGDRLTIKGEKTKEQEEKGEHFHCTERCYGCFQRSFRLPTNVQPDKVEATFEKGILTITLPKTEEAKSKAIKIEIK
jgi:HSP20 family protein